MAEPSMGGNAEYLIHLKSLAHPRAPSSMILLQILDGPQAEIGAIGLQGWRRVELEAPQGAADLAHPPRVCGAGPHAKSCVPRG